MLAKAIMLASELFVTIEDKSKEPYILHCIDVMKNLNSKDHELMTIAILHDVVEDTYVTFQDLRTMGYSNRVIEALKLLTHEDGVAYDDYIDKIAESGNEDARLVKLADLESNLDVKRLKGLTEHDFRRIKKYQKAHTQLSRI